MTEHAPDKKELSTHEGVIYFPSEFMPPLAELDHEKPMLPIMSQSKKLNLKLKFKQPKLQVRNSMVVIRTSASPIFSIR